jgi:cytochrome P450
MSYVADRAMNPFHAPSWLPTPARRRARNASKMLHKLARDILTACRRDPERDAPLVRALMEASDPDTGRPLSDDEICDELIVFMLAGHDTTATTLTYALWQLGRHRPLQDRVRAEVHALGPDGPRPQDVPRLTYTTQVLHEALRLCPPGAALTRSAVRDIDVDGYRVQAGSVVAFGIWAVQRDPALWPDPLCFDPERFRPDRAKQIERYQYLPFGAGPRSCIGDHFAMLEATLALATIIGRCEIGSLTDDFPVAVPFTVVASEPVRAIVVKR